MNLQSTLQIHGFGTPEGACKAVNTRGDKAARACGGATDDAPASTIQISNWLDDKGLPTEMVKGVVKQLTALGMSPKLMKFPFSVQVNDEKVKSIPDCAGIYNPNTKILSINTALAYANDVVHELTHWAMFSQMPGISKHSDFLPDSTKLDFPDSPGLKEDTQAMMQEYTKSHDKAVQEIRDKQFDEEKQNPVGVRDFFNMSNKEVKRAGAPSGYALIHPAEWVAEVAAEDIAQGKSAPPMTEKLVKNLWSGKYIQ